MTQIILLTQGKSALVDDETYTLVSALKWYARLVHGAWYALSNAPQLEHRPGPIYMHRLVMGAQSGQRIDHRDGDGLNNQRSNLRFCTHSENMQNTRRRHRSGKTSQYRGVSLNGAGKWSAQISVKTQHVWLGSHEDEVSAARAYDRAALKDFGEFAVTNFPREQYA